MNRNWIDEQEQLKSQVICSDTYDWQHKRCISRVGGVDLSFIKGDENVACAALVICEYPDFNVVYEDVKMVPLTAPYEPGFLAFREAPALIEAFSRLCYTNPSLVPECVLVDGNGILHPRGFGLASHIGVLCNVPTVGVAKSLLVMDGILRDEDHKHKISLLRERGDHFSLNTISGKTLGLAVKTSDSSKKPMYVSVGHKISLHTAAWLVCHCSKYRIPEPVRQADIRSREFIRKNY
ncbi:endonuclease V-like [Zootermopsis nevadensis]|uniref:Endonuclease V n=1 Tax=Zootermopsis nevadensis TaxID=136037 RepID=A0A067RNL0_ZOONE|nr:endonuclease V-like [Zootermopsis nevadensis]KDR21324.1 Putative endonuclease [Zootermopsis nevadensis]